MNPFSNVLFFYLGDLALSLFFPQASIASTCCPGENPLVSAAMGTDAASYTGDGVA